MKKRGRKSKNNKEAELEKQEKKPWGKKERYIVLGVLLSTIIFSAILAISARSWKLPNMPRIGVPDDIFEDTFVIENQKKDSNKNTAVSDFVKKTQSLSGVYGFSVINLVDDTKYSKLNKEIFQAASLIKLPLMTYVYELAEDNRINLDSIHTLTEADKVGGSGSLYYEDIGTIITIRELVRAMGKESDNTAFNILRNKVGQDNLQNYIDEIGMRKTSVQENTTTIEDVSEFFVKLWEKRLVNADHRDEILEFLTNTIYEDHLPALISDIDIAHKYGREVHVVNDAGIVFADKPFVLVLMSKGVVEKEADQALPELAKLLFDYETNR